MPRPALVLRSPPLAVVVQTRRENVSDQRDPVVLAPPHRSASPTDHDPPPQRYVAVHQPVRSADQCPADGELATIHRAATRGEYRELLAPSLALIQGATMTLVATGSSLTVPIIVMAILVVLGVVGYVVGRRNRNNR